MASVLGTPFSSRGHSASYYEPLKTGLFSELSGSRHRSHEDWGWAYKLGLKLGIPGVYERASRLMLSLTSCMATFVYLRVQDSSSVVSICTRALSFLVRLIAQYISVIVVLF